MKCRPKCPEPPAGKQDTLVSGGAQNGGRQASQKVPSPNPNLPEPSSLLPFLEREREEAKHEQRGDKNDAGNLEQTRGLEETAHPAASAPKETGKIFHLRASFEREK